MYMNDTPIAGSWPGNAPALQGSLRLPRENDDNVEPSVNEARGGIDAAHIYMPSKRVQYNSSARFQQ